MKFFININKTLIILFKNAEVHLDPFIHLKVIYLKLQQNIF